LLESIGDASVSDDVSVEEIKSVLEEQ
jgi:hypothetical protein